jgi:hypothetical protein
VYIYCLVVNNTTVDYNAFWCNGLVADSLTLLHNQQLRLAGWGFNPGWRQVSRFALGVFIYNLTTLHNSHGIQEGLGPYNGLGTKFQSLGGCKLYQAYYSSHNVYIYCLVVNNTTVDYNAFWCNGLVADSLTLLQPRGNVTPSIPIAPPAHSASVSIPIRFLCHPL